MVKTIAILMHLGPKSLMQISIETVRLSFLVFAYCIDVHVTLLTPVQTQSNSRYLALFTLLFMSAFCWLSAASFTEYSPSFYPIYGLLSPYFSPISNKQ